jgi:hypothetical protein
MISTARKTAETISAADFKNLGLSGVFMSSFYFRGCIDIGDYLLGYSWANRLG